MPVGKYIPVNDLMSWEPKPYDLKITWILPSNALDFEFGFKKEFADTISCI